MCPVTVFQSVDKAAYIPEISRIWAALLQFYLCYNRNIYFRNFNLKCIYFLIGRKEKLHEFRKFKQYGYD